MNHIEPITRPLNHNEVLTWEQQYYDKKMKYDDFIEFMSEKGLGVEKAKEKWLYNYGAIPPSAPIKYYHCTISNSDVKILCTVIENDTPKKGERKYQVIKLNHLYLDTYDYKRVMVKENGIVKMKLIYKNLLDEEDFSNLHDTLFLDIDSQEEQTQNDVEIIKDDLDFKDKLSELIVGDTLQLEFFSEDKVAEKKTDDKVVYNYEDSNWFTSLAINNILSNINIEIPAFDKEKSEIPTIFMKNVDSMTIVKFNFTDNDFKEKLYDEINKKFEKAISLIR